MRCNPACTSLTWLPTAILALVSVDSFDDPLLPTPPLLVRPRPYPPNDVRHKCIDIGTHLLTAFSAKSYIAHSSLSITLPLHLLYLKYTTRQSTASHIKRAIATLRHHLTPASTQSRAFPTRRLIILLLCLTVGITMPAVLWYIAVLLASCVLISSPKP